MCRALLLLSHLLFFSTNLYAQRGGDHFKHLSTPDGLSQSSVISIHQDQLGQMWFGTRDGLNKYDGSRFTIYRNNPNDSASLSSNDILSLSEDQAGCIWVGTHYGLNCYNPKGNVFRRFLPFGSLDSLNNGTVWCVTEIGDEEMWVGTSEGLSVYNRKTNAFTTFFHDDHDSTSLPSSHVRSIVQTRDGTVWVGASKGVCRLTQRKDDKLSFQTYSYSDSLPAYVQDILEDQRDSTLWIATKENGLLKFDPRISSFVSTEVDQPTYAHSDVRALSQDQYGNVWAGTYDGLIIRQRNGHVRQLVSEPSVPTSLSKSSVKSVYTDRKGSVWVGTYHGGVNVWDRSNNNFFNLDETLLHYDVISAIAGDSSTLYFATEGQGVTQLDTGTGESVSIGTDRYDELSGDHIKSLLLTNEGKLWMGTFKNGINLYDVRAKQFVNYTIADSLRQLLHETGVYVIREGKQHDIWFGAFGQGVLRYDSLTQDYERFTAEGSTRSLSNDQVRTLVVDQHKSVWVGTQSGLNRIVWSEGRYDLKSVEQYFVDEAGGTGDDILTLFESSQGQLWVGTKARGLFRYNGTNFDPVDVAVPDVVITAVHAVLEDDRQNLWLSTNQGIVKYAVATQTATLYDQRDGLANHEFNDNAALKVGNRYYLGGLSGVTSFDPARIVISSYVPPVILTDLKIKNQPVSPRDDQGVLQETITYTKSLTLAHHQSTFSLAYALPVFVNPTSHRYRYRLVGLQDHWTTTSQTEVTYTVQNPGTYRFEVMGANSDGVWNQEPTVLDVIVRPAPWRSPWALAGYLLIFIGVLYGALRLVRYYTTLRLQLKLEYLAAERHQEVHQEKLRFFTNISHDFRTPLTLIIGPLQQLLADYRGSYQMYRKLLVIESSANHLLKLINRLMDFRKFENDHTGLRAAEGNLAKFTREVYLSFVEFARDRDCVYTFDASDDEIPVYYDRDKLERVFYNLISNAFRYTPRGGKIALSLRREQDTAVFTVRDSGPGISAENLEKVFDRFFETSRHRDSPVSYYKGTGIGLSIAKEIITLHKGEIKARNGERGAIFTVRLALGRYHLTDEEIIDNFRLSDDVSQYEEQLERPEVTQENNLSDLILDDNAPTVLLAEDHAPLRHFVKDILRQHYNVIEAENGREAQEKALKHVPDLIISDVLMPEMAGTELCARIKKDLRTSHIPVILLTARTPLIYKLEGLENGADDYISKPFSVKELELRVRNQLDTVRRLRKKLASEDVLAPSEVAVSSLDEKLLQKALAVVEENIANERFDIASFCEELGVSRSILFTKMKAWTGSTPNEFIRHLRMQRAAHLLEQDRLTVAEVSYQVGFRNPKYFSKCFQKKFGHTPSEHATRFSENF